MDDLKAIIGKVATGAALSRDEAASAFDRMMSGEATPSQMGALLMGLRVRGETVDEITGAVSAMRSKMLTVKAPADAVDIVGTGGDGSGSVNVSTCASFILAGAGVPVAKHGNRAASSKAGAADTLEALGLDMARAGAGAEASLNALGICFLFAANHHPAMKRITPIRRRIGRRTIFNLMGPLANPARVTRQLIGIARPDYAPVYAEALEQLGTEAALVVSGEEGLDEVSGAGPTVAVSIGDIALPDRIVPEDAGLPRHPIAAIHGGDPDYNALVLRRLLKGERGAYRDAVLLNAAAALVLAGRATDLSAGAAVAAGALDSGAANDLLDRWIAFA